jgi:hypothetical protein
MHFVGAGKWGKDGVRDSGYSEQEISDTEQLF